MRDSTAWLISLGIGIALQSPHASSARAAASALGPPAVDGALTMDADAAPRADAQATPAVSVINETTSRAKRTICIQNTESNGSNGNNGSNGSDTVSNESMRCYVGGFTTLRNATATTHP